MTKRDFFRLVIKLIALNSIIASFLAVASQFLNLHLDSNLLLDIFGIGVLSIIFLTLFIYLIISFTDKIIDFFKLDKGFDNDKIEINSFSNVLIIKLIIIFIGGTLIAQNFAQLFVDIINIFKFQAYGNLILDKKPEMYWVHVRFVAIAFGVILLSNTHKIAKYLDEK
jgi:hypothetical protein